MVILNIFEKGSNNHHITYKGMFLFYNSFHVNKVVVIEKYMMENYSNISTYKKSEDDNGLFDKDIEVFSTQYLKIYKKLCYTYISYL